jgi:4-diphosphocytidyl-2-C-methyl-D-erythritol kinase
VLRYRTVSKINLTLEITGLLPDGRHALETWFQAIDYGDELEVELADGLTLTCDDANLGAQEENLAWKAADLLRRAAGVDLGARLHLAKKVPYGAGLGGGSGDAAAVLVACNRLWGLDWAPGRLEEIGKALGADVPFLVRGGAAWATGAGDELTPCQGLSADIEILVATPPVPVPTGWAYKTWDELHPSPLKDGKALTNFPALHSKDCFPLEALRGRLFNSFEEVVYPRFPEVEQVRQEMVQAGAAATLLSGSGSSIFGLFSSQEAPVSILEGWDRRGVRRRWCRPAAGPMPI